MPNEAAKVPYQLQCITQYILYIGLRPANTLSSYFQGEHLQSGSRLVDYFIGIGDTECVPVSLTDTEVICEPPRTRPVIDVKVSSNDTMCPNDTLPTDVCIHVVYFELLYLI